MELLEAYQLACSLHTGQLDKARRPYIEHLTRVLLRVQAAGGDLAQQIAALLHDAIENGRATKDDLLQIFQVPADAVELVVVLSRRPGETYMEYLSRVKAVVRAVPVKLEDLADNNDPNRLGLLPTKDAMGLGKRYSQAIHFLTEA